MASLAINPFPTTISQGGTPGGSPLGLVYSPINGEVRRISGPKIERRFTDITNVEDMVYQNHPSIPPNIDFTRRWHAGLVSLGSLTFEMNYVLKAYSQLLQIMSITGGTAMTQGSSGAPTDVAEYLFKLAFSDSTNFTFTGYIESLGVAVTFGDGVICDVSIKLNRNFSTASS